MTAAIASNCSENAGWISPRPISNLYHGGKLVRRGRPKAAITKIHTGIRLDADVLAAFKAQGPGWQTRINAALRDWLQQHAQKPAH